MNSKEIDFSTADLGLVADVEIEEEGDFDAFNEDTFGADDVWHEEDHEELAKYTEEEKQTLAERDGFFDFDDQPDFGRHQNGRHDEINANSNHEPPDITELARELTDKARLRNLPQSIHDPAIVNVMHQPPASMHHPPVQLLPPTHFMTPAMQHRPPMPPAFMQHPGFGIRPPVELNDPAIMSMAPPVMMMMQQQRHLSQPPPPNHQMNLNHEPTAGVRTLEELGRQLRGEAARQQQAQQHQQQLQHQQAQYQQRQHEHNLQQLHHHLQQLQQQQEHSKLVNHQHQLHHQGPPPQINNRNITNQQNNYGHHGGRGPNSFPHQHSNQHQHYQHQHQHQQMHQHRHRNPFDNKNRETFGDDFVESHSVSHQRHHRDNQHLITPGHVHVLGILRGAREKRGLPTGPEMIPESTGNPRRDLELQRQAAARRQQILEEQQYLDDDFAGLMSQRERQWIINIQLNQLKCENPFLDDYYYTVFKLRQDAAKSAENSDSNSANVSDLSNEFEKRTTKPDEEGAQLLIQPDSPRSIYTPLQFQNSLGKLQAATVKAPRKIIDVGILNAEASESNAQKDSRNFKLTLLELERLYDLLIEVEDCEKKLMALPTNTPMRIQVEEERDVAVKKFGSNLTVGNRLKRYLMVRKGKILMKRGLRLLDVLQMGLVCTNLLQHFSGILKRDREEQLLAEFWSNGMKVHLLSAPAELIEHYFSIMTAPSYSLKPVLGSNFGCSIVMAIIHQCAMLIADQDDFVGNIQGILVTLGQKISECSDISGPLALLPFQTPDCKLPSDCLQQLHRLKESNKNLKVR